MNKVRKLLMKAFSEMTLLAATIAAFSHCCLGKSFEPPLSEELKNEIKYAKKYK